MVRITALAACRACCLRTRHPGMPRCQELSQEPLALLAEVDRSYVGRVERGDNKVAILTLRKLARAVGTTVAKLNQRAGL